MRITLNTKNNIIIYTKKINFNLTEYDFLHTIKEYSLSEEEKKYILHKKNHSLRCQSLTSITIAKQAIKETLCLEYNEFEIKRDDLSRPYIKLPQYNTIDLNISHSGDYVVCAISSFGRIGIDIEETIPVDINISEGFLSKQELHYLSNAKINQSKLFYKYWTLKESYLKAIGIGLIDSITELNIGKLTFNNNILKREINNEMWNFYNTPFKENYSLSLAFNKPIQNITFIDL